MEIEIGEYIRTKNGLIAKVCAYQELIIYDDKGESAKFYSFDTDKGTIADVEIEEHSKNIIDVVEIGGYVNGYKVITLTRLNEKEISICIYKDIEEMKCIILQDKDIKTVLTKEQFENAEYRIPEEK